MPCPGQRLEPARAPAQLISDDCGSSRGVACRRRQRDGCRSKRSFCGAERHSDNKGYRLGRTGIRTGSAGCHDHAALSVGSFGEPQQIASTEVARRPRHRQVSRGWIDLRDEQQTRHRACDAAALQRQPGEPNAASSLASPNPRQCGDVAVSAGILRQVQAKVRVCQSARSSGSDMAAYHTGRQMTLRYATRDLKSEGAPLYPCRQSKNLIIAIIDPGGKTAAFRTHFRTILFARKLGHQSYTGCLGAKVAKIRLGSIIDSIGELFRRTQSIVGVALCLFGPLQLLFVTSGAMAQNRDNRGRG